MRAAGDRASWSGRYELTREHASGFRPYAPVSEYGTYFLRDPDSTGGGR